MPVRDIYLPIFLIILRMFSDTHWGGGQVAEGKEPPPRALEGKAKNEIVKYKQICVWNEGIY